jgi:abelson tyrosine-protein kinase 1
VRLSLVCPIPRHVCVPPTQFVPGGTLRWQAPELMQGAQALTQEMDVYAFAICCVEILTHGTLPWPLMDDDAVRRFVLSGYFVHLYTHSSLTFLSS